MRSAIVVAVGLVALALAAPALAHRPATTNEAKQLVYEPSGRYYHHLPVAEPRSVPLRCFIADISTVVRGSRWGAVGFSKYATHHEQQCRVANGIGIEHKIGTRWYTLWEGSDGYPPTHGSQGLKGVPRAIAKDLIAGLNARGS